jgi:light-regulated signal transduction histidine kinase (bacteriophytochrome)
MWNGRVVAEQVDWSRTRDLFRGLNFPASDIPAQARELYRINKVRVLYDRDQPTARLCCRSLEEVALPLDMTHCHLRAMSPIHIKYLGNMGVRSSMSISITAFGDLWGLIALHTYGRYGHRVSFPVRQLCKLLGQSISRNIERISYASRLQARKLINTAASDQNPSGYIIAKAEDLLDLFHADFGVLSIGDEAKVRVACTSSRPVRPLT